MERMTAYLKRYLQPDLLRVRWKRRAILRLACSPTKPRLEQVKRTGSGASPDTESRHRGDPDTAAVWTQRVC